MSESTEQPPKVILASHGDETFVTTVATFKTMAAGADILNPDGHYVLGCGYTVSGKSLKHIIEHRSERNEDVDLILSMLPKVIASPEGEMPNSGSKKYPDTYLIGKPIPNTRKTAILVVDHKNKQVINAYFQRTKEFLSKIKKQRFATGEAPSGV